MTGLLLGAGLVLAPLQAAPGPGSPRAERLKEYREECAERLRLWEPGSSARSRIPLSPAASEPAKDYYRCMALAKGQDYCRGFDRLGAGGDAASEPSAGCRNLWRSLTIYRALIARDPEAPRICERAMATMLGRKAGRGCEILLSGRPPSELCARLLTDLDLDESPREQARCRLRQSVSRGFPVDCATVADDPTVHRECRALDAYRRASEARDPSLCGDLPLCRVMMGAGPEACAELAQRAKTVSCEQWASAKFVERLPAIEAEERMASGHPARP